jgi:hypothetical protein
MNPTAVLLVAIALGTCVSAQTPPASQPAYPDIVVQDYRWGVTHRTRRADDPIFKADSSGRRANTRDDPINTMGNPVNTMGVPMGTNPVRPQGSPPTRDPGVGQIERIENVEVRRENYMLVKNVSAKVIKTIDWNYIFFNDANLEQELKRYKYHSKKKIAPGELKFVSEYVDRRALSEFQAVVINKIEFTDGSVWQRQ